MKINIFKMHSLSEWLFVVLFGLLFALILDFPVIDLPKNFLVKDAEAVVGRPATPASVGGVRRRTRRRTAAVVSYGTRVNAAPAGSQKIVVNGTTYYVHDGVYYKPAHEGDNVVYVVVEDPKKNQTIAENADTQTQPDQAKSEETTKTIEQELQDLQNLYNKGLINQQEYEAKKKEILDSM